MKLIFNRLLFILWILKGSTGICQVGINKPIIFIDAQEENRTVDGLAPVTDLDDLVNAREVLLNKHIYAVSSMSGDTLIASFSVQAKNYFSGMKIQLQIPDETFENIKYLKIDTLPGIQIIRGNGGTVLKNDFKPGQVYTLIYNGNSFVLMKRKIKECPENFVEINPHYCISQDETGYGSFHDAVLDCNALNARLCTWAEWTYACQSHISSLSQMTNNYEWVDSGAVSEGGAKVTGNGNCFFNTARDAISQPNFYRCCYVR